MIAAVPMSPLRALAWRVLLAVLLLVPGPGAMAQPASGARNYLWEVTSLTGRVYLYGTVHAGKSAWFPLPAAVEKAFAESPVLVVEADITNAEAMTKSSAQMVYAPPDKLANHVEAADYARFRKLVARYGIPEREVDTLKPLMAASLLVFSEWGRLGYLPRFGIEGYLLTKAERVKEVVELEGVAAQSALMDSLTDAESRTAFSGTLQALESGLTSEQITGMVNAWQTGDPALLLEVARKYNQDVPGSAVIEEKFIWSRHAEMVKKIEGFLLQPRRPHFVAVGALHLAGPRGLVELLKARGYLVRQL